jgi:hypothetical protein
MAVFEILVDDFDLAFHLDLWSSGFPLSCGSWIHSVCIRVVSENKRACEENDTGENSTAEDRTVKDPRGTDPDRHGGTFLTAMIANWIKENEIT